MGQLVRNRPHHRRRIRKDRISGNSDRGGLYSRSVKKALESFIERYAEYQEVLAEPVLEYYDLRRSAWGNPPADDPKYPEVKDSQQLRSMYTLKSIVIHDPDSSDPDSIGLLYDYTWDDEGMGIRMTGLHVDEIGIQGTQY